MASRKSTTPVTYSKKEKSCVTPTVNISSLGTSSNSSFRSGTQVADTERERERDREALMPLSSQIRTIIEHMAALTVSRVPLKTKDRLTAYRSFTSRLLQLLQSAGETFTSRDRYLILRERSLVTALQSSIGQSSDNQVIINIVKIFIELVGRSPSKRRVRCLVRCGVTDTLIRIVVDASRGAVWDDDLMLCTHNALFIVGRRDKKFPLKIRLSGTLGVTVKLLRRFSGNNTQSKTLLSVLKLALQSPQNSAAIGKQDCFTPICKILCSGGRSHSAVARLALDVLRAVVRSSKQNAVRAVRDGAVGVVLSLIVNVNGAKLSVNGKQRDSARTVRLAALQCLRTLTQTEPGRAGFNECGGLIQLFGVCVRDASFRQDDELAQCAVNILSRCAPLINLPIDLHRHPVTFSVFDDAATGGSSAVPHYDVDSTWLSPAGLSSARRCVEESCGAIDSDIESSNAEERNSDTVSSVAQSSVKDRKGVASKSNPGKSNRPLSAASFTNGDSLEPNEVDSIDDANAGLGADIDEQVPPVCDERDWQSLQSYSRFFAEFDPNEALLDCDASTPLADIETDSSRLEKSQRAQLYTELNRAYTRPVIPQLHVKLAYPDLVGHAYAPTALPPDFSVREPLHGTKQRTLRRRILEDLARFAEPQRLLSNVVYDLDALLMKEKEVPRCFQFPYNSANVVVSVGAAAADVGAASELSSLPVASSPLSNDDEKRVVIADIPISGKQRAQVNDTNSNTTLQFESRFECGNLRRAVQIRDFEYDLVLNSDVGSNRPQQWFYFAVANTRANVRYRFNILNFDKDRNLFCSGMKPVIYSVQEAVRGRSYWVRSGLEVCYYRNFYRKPATPLVDGSDSQPADAGTGTGAAGTSTRYFTLSFVLKFKHSSDVVYIAYHYPYTYTTLGVHLRDWRMRAAALNRNEDRVFYREQTLCETVGGHRVPLLTITSNSRNVYDVVDSGDSSSLNETLDQSSLQQILEAASANVDVDVEPMLQNDEKRKTKQYVVITSRVHPSESNSSWVMRGITNFLLGDTAAASALRDRFVFKIVPMLNPDGVVNGNTRFALTPDDLNRRWIQPSPIRHSSIYHAKGLLQFLRAIGHSAFLYCDLHGHARQRSVFIYGCDPLSSWLKDDYKFVTHRNGPRQIRALKAFPKLLHDRCTAFSFPNSSFKIQRAKESTARIVVWRQLGILRSYTLEASFCGGDRPPLAGSHFTSNDFELVGALFCEALHELAADPQSASDRMEFVDLIRSATGVFSPAECQNQLVAPPSSANYEPLAMSSYPQARQLPLRKTAPFAKLRTASANAVEREYQSNLAAGSGCQLPRLAGTNLRNDAETAGLAKRFSAQSLDVAYVKAANAIADGEGASSESGDSDNDKDTDEEDEDELDSQSDADAGAETEVSRLPGTTPTDASINLFVDEEDETEQDGYDLYEQQP